ncbi:hypothetical protein G7062_04170 [Erysipelothrix sp. HDW6C]|uniref:DUF5677 domain-containing protein n=1 Tax=Erysipelothrix sp. HDW6C TaxID=2714930 RepID=UPI00140CA607|nr:DUF5677 domain-containing protein [Erysipelothrix sp. HDW6C]QIK69540.1 hypothetical protein G7062_04170 [Erysipelothrix sp. HDW6C]
MRYDEYLDYLDECIDYCDQRASEIIEHKEININVFDNVTNDVKEKLNGEFADTIGFLKVFHILTVDYMAEILKQYRIDCFSNQIVPNEDMFYLHTRALRTYLEVVILISNGLSDGAYARNRTNYEIISIMRVFNKYKDDASKAFRNTKINSNKWILDIEKISKDFSSRMTQWSRKNSLSNKDIALICSGDGFDYMKKWEEVYRTSNNILHVNYEGTYSSISSKGEIALNPGHSNGGIALVSDHAVQLIAIANSIFIDYMFCLGNKSQSLISLIHEFKYTNHFLVNNFRMKNDQLVV